MGKKRHTAEEIVSKLRQVDVLTAQGRTVAEAIRQIGVTEVTYYRWRNEYGGLKSDQVKRLKELEIENARLRRAVSDLTLEKLILKEEAASEPEGQRQQNWRAGSGSTTDRASADGRSLPIRCGRMASSRSAPMTDAGSACSTSSTRSRANA